MSRELSTALGAAIRDTVPFLVITVVWSGLMLLFYALFLVGKPAGASYGPAVHTSVFIPPLVGFLGHTLREALKPS